MGEVSWQKVETIVDQALELPEEERRSFINEQCKDDDQLKGEVTLLLESIFKSKGWLEDDDHLKRDLFEEIAGNESAQSFESEHDALLGSILGSFTLKERIGEGGMGSIYRAERSKDDINHQVAIKMIRRGQTTPSNIRRFRREQQILAGLHHPGIARLYDIGMTDDGLPYLIMEYVDGIPIDAYCRQHNCSLEEKIELFKQVLQSVSYAHENLVVHRDLKPGNILVDQNGQIKILDFGISKLMQDSDEAGSITQTGDRLFTPRYAAPEQIRQKNISTATDLYTLGIILYELLTSHGPFQFDECTRHEIENTILKNSPSPPSSQVNSRALRQKIRGDLDAIILKAMRKDAKDRYRTANGFLDDLNNYQQGIPVTAVKGSRSYQLKKFYQRHKRGVLVSCLVVILTFGLTVFFTYQLAQERDQAETAALKEKKVSDFLLNLFESNYPEFSGNKEITARQLLQKGRKDADHLKNSAVRAHMLGVIGKAYSKLGFKDSALAVLQRVKTITKKEYGRHSLPYAEASFNIGNVYSLNSYDDLSLPYLKEAYKIRSSKLTSSNPKIPQTLLKIGEAFSHLERADSARFYLNKSLHNLRLNKDSNRLLFIKAQEALAQFFSRQGNFEEAEKRYKKIFSSKYISTVDSLTISAWQENFAWVYIPEKKFKKALPLLQHSLKIAESKLGKGHISTQKVRNDLAGVNSDLGNFDRFEELSESNIKYTTKRYGFAHKMTCQVSSAVGLQLTVKKRFDEAEKYLRKALKSCREALGNNHTWTAAQKAELAANLALNGKKKASEAYFIEGYKVLNKNKANFNRVNKRQVSFIIQLYKMKEPYDSLRIQKLDHLLSSNK